MIRGLHAVLSGYLTATLLLVEGLVPVYAEEQLPSASVPSTPSASARLEHYLHEVKPLLQERCYACHGVLKQEGNLRLDTASQLLQGGDSGPAVVAGKLDESPLFERITAEAALRMPPEGPPLSPTEIDHLRNWIASGAIAPKDEAPQTDPADHWAFQPLPDSLNELLARTGLDLSTLAAPATPDEQSTNRPVISTLIEQLLAQVHQSRGLTAASPAAPERLLRRVSLDLIGIPPTPEELARFLSDPSEETYTTIVDELLANPLYGERWGRHWMDVWRYSDWSGEGNNQARGSPEHIWRWRDWIIESLNADLGYDQMLQLMLAADELTPHDLQQLRATGFLARNWYKFNRNVWLDDTVEHTAKAFLGLTFNCAKCHDHKYDPISQEHYYQFRAFFEPHDIKTEPLEPASTVADQKQTGGKKSPPVAQLVRVYDAQPDAPTYLFHRGEESQPIKDRTIPPGIPAVLGELPPIEPRHWETSDSETLTSTGRRLALARWLTAPDNPLTARVAVNHVWLRHFGQPLVADVTDFGLRSERPELVDLLDLLAVAFVQSGWSFKQLHRDIVLSAAYRRDSDFLGSPSQLAENQRIDPDNRLLWRMPARRLEAEAIRDSLLAVAGTLDTTSGGPEVPLEDRESSRRRSLYFRHGLERQVPFLEIFDGASVLECYQRESTIIPQQALALVNDVVVREQSRRLARDLSEQATEPGSFVHAAYLKVLSRAPSQAEQEKCIDFLQSQANFVRTAELTYPDEAPAGRLAPAADPQLRARESLIHVLLNHHDFITLR